MKRIQRKEQKQIMSVRLTRKQRQVIEASARMNKVTKSRVISESINSYFNMK